MTPLPADFDKARRILELAEQMLSQETGSIVQPQTLEEKLAANIASAFEDDEENEK